jgi:hypothetical protein
MWRISDTASAFCEVKLSEAELAPPLVMKDIKES